MMGKVAEVSDAEFTSFINSEEPVLVDFWAPWCGPCKMLSPVVEELASDMTGKLKVGKMNVDDNPKTSGQFGVMSIPTLLVFRKGEVVKQLVGYMPKKELQNQLNDVLG